jgi:hypothetical protein
VQKVQMGGLHMTEMELLQKELTEESGFNYKLEILESYG